MLPLALRNLVAETALAALSGTEYRPAFDALAAFARGCDDAGAAELAPEFVERLAADPDVFRVEATRVMLVPGLASAVPDLRRATADLAAVINADACGAAPFDWHNRETLPAAGAPEPAAADVRWSLCAAGALFNRGRYFEVHEVLEAVWLRTRGDRYEFIKGLIQVAVGFYHHGNGNLAGARALLAEGHGRLRGFRPQFLGLPLDGFCEALRRCVDQVERGGRAAAAPFADLPVFPPLRPGD